MLVALWAEHRALRARTPRAATLSRAATALAVSAGLALVIATGYWHEHWGSRTTAHGVLVDLPAAVGFALLIAALACGRGPATAGFRWRPLIGAGLVSYGIYLWHIPVILDRAASRDPADPDRLPAGGRPAAHAGAGDPELGLPRAARHAPIRRGAKADRGDPTADAQQQAAGVDGPAASEPESAAPLASSLPRSAATADCGVARLAARTGHVVASRRVGLGAG